MILKKITIALVVGVFALSIFNIINPAKLREQRYLDMEDSYELMPTKELKKLVDQGNISAMEEYAGRHCGNKTNNYCYEFTLQAAEGGHPDAMKFLSMIQSLDDSKDYDLYSSYLWILIKIHFYRDKYLFDHSIVRGFQKLEESGDTALINFTEERLSPEEIERARNEAKERAPEIWVKLQQYCEEWAETDFVCFYKFRENPLQHEKYKDE